MQITISSVLTMCFLNSILVVVLCMLFKSRLVMRKIGPGCMIVLLILAVIRMFLPLAFSFTYDIRIEDVLTAPFRFLSKAVISEPFEITVWNILTLVWILGIVLNIVYKLYAYHDVIRCISLCPQEKWEDLSQKYQFDAEKYEGIEDIRVICSKRFSSPFLIGLRRPCLILPDVPYETGQFHYIILHEWMHVVHKDILWKILVELLCTAFWWNPVFRYLKKELFQLIEMRNDMQIVSGLAEKERIAYMECLADTAAQLVGKDMAFGVSFCKKNLRELTRRIELIADGREFSRWRQITVSGVVCALLIMTFLIVFAPYSNDAPEGTPITDETGFLIRNGEQYDVYMGDKYIFTTDDLSAFPDMEIYNNMQEVKENE